MHVRHVQLLLAVVAITHAIISKPTTSVAVNTTHVPTELGFTANGDKSDGMMNANVLVNHDVAETKATTFAAGSSTSLVDKPTYIADGNNGERGGGNLVESISEGVSKLVEKVKGAVRPSSSAEANLDEYQVFLNQAVELHRTPSSVIKKLKKMKYDDKRIAGLIEKAKLDENYANAAVKLETAQMKNWLNEKKSVGEVFELLGLTQKKDDVIKPVDDLLAHPLFQYWSMYVERFSERFSQAEKSAYGFLTPTYYKDAELTDLIVKAKKETKSKSNAVQLGKEQLTEWRNKGLSVDQVFDLLQLNTVEDGLLTHPLFSHWYQYLEMVNAAEHGEKTTIVTFLTQYAEKRGISFETFLENEVKTANFETKNSIEELFVELRLNRIKNDLFSNPLFDFWRNCLEKFNRIQLKKSAKIRVDKVLRTVYGDKGLVDLLRAERQVETTAKRASEIEKELCWTWASEGKLLDEVFELLELNRADYKILEDPLMETFATFTNAFITENKQMKAATKEPTFEVAEMLESVPRASETGTFSSTKLENALLQLWFTQSKDPNDLLAMFFGGKNLDKIVKDKGNLFEEPLFFTWFKYTKGYHKTKGIALNWKQKLREKQVFNNDLASRVGNVDRETDMADLLLDVFKDRKRNVFNMIVATKKSLILRAKYTAQEVERRLFLHWKTNSTPNKIFTTDLGLKPKMKLEKLFEKPLFHLWIDYINFISLQLHANGELSAILTTIFKSEANRNWLIEAHTDKRTEELADKVWKQMMHQNIIREKKKNLTPSGVDADVANDVKKLDAQQIKKRMAKKWREGVAKVRKWLKQLRGID